jgi:hypothetical protein
VPKPRWSARRLSGWFSPGHVSALTLLAGLAAGCSPDAVRMAEPAFTGSTPNQQRIITSQTYASRPQVSAAPTMPSGAVMAQPLPVLTGPPGAVAPASLTADAPQPYVPPKPWAAKDLPTPVGVIVPR